MLLLTNGDNNKPYGLLPPDSSSRKALDIFQHLGWGSHLCLLYQQKTDLLNLLVPYIQAGLENHEYCICISAEPLYLQQTHIALWKAIPEFGQYYKKGQIAFISSKEWHLGKGKVRVDDLAHRCFSRLNQALAQGYNGLRISTHNTWMQNKYWNSFQDYEACLDNMIQDYKMITMCSYSLDKCQATHILDLCRNHQCTYIYSPEGCQAIKRADIDTTPDRSHVNSPIPTHYFLGQRTVDPNPNLHILNEMLQAEIRRHSRTEEALHLSDHRYRSLFNTIDEGFSIYKICQSNNGPREYQCLDVNPAFAALLGYPQEYLIGKKLEQALPELYEELNPYLDMVASARKSIHTEADIEAWQKTISFCIIYLEPGQIAIITQDITEQKQAQQSLRQSEEKFYLAFHSSPSIMSITTLEDWVYLDVNEMFCAQTGYSREEVIGKSFRDINLWRREEDPKAIKDMILRGIPIQNYEVSFITKDGESRVGLMSSEIININGCPCLLNSLIDISQRIQLQEELARLDCLHLIGQMAASISHETRNPMTTVRGFLQMLKTKPEYEKDEEYFNIMIEELDRADSIISEFLSLAPNMKLQLEPGNINHIIDSLSALMQADALAHDKFIEIHLGEIPDQLLDRKEIRQLLLNLVRNAIDAIGPQQTVKISTYTQNGDIVLEVKDPCCGMPAEVMSKLGTPFFTTKEHGTGLGLSVCYSIAERHNAKIDIDSSPSGTTFFVRFKQ
jgi:two-component system, sporulation sensor kinase E